MFLEMSLGIGFVFLMIAIADRINKGTGPLIVINRHYHEGNEHSEWKGYRS